MAEPAIRNAGRTLRPHVLSLGRSMGVKNFLVEGVSCTGKTSVCDELQRRGYHCIHGDRDLAYWGDPKTGEPLESSAYEHWIWDVDKVRALVADQSHAASFFCGGSRNLDRIDLLESCGIVLLRRFEESRPIHRSARWSFCSRGRSGHAEPASCPPTRGRVGRPSKRRGIQCAIATRDKRRHSRERDHNRRHGTHRTGGRRDSREMPTRDCE